MPNKKEGLYYPDGSFKSIQTLRLEAMKKGELPQECFKSQNYNKLPKVRTNKHRRKNNRTNFTKKK